MLRTALRSLPPSSSIGRSALDPQRPIASVLRVSSLRSSQPLRRSFYDTTRDQPSRPPESVRWGHLARLKITGTEDQSLLKEALAKSPDEIWSTRSKTTMTTLRPPKDTYAGRSVEVNGDIAHALNKLKTILKNNYVRPEWLAQKRHEKKGNRRRRLASLRWRRRFSYEVQKKIQLVNAIRARGA